MDIKYYDHLLNIVGGGEVIEYIELLERENKALTQEGEEKCEKLERLEIALDKACHELSNVPWIRFTREGNGKRHRTKEWWKEWCMNDE